MMESDAAARIERFNRAAETAWRAVLDFVSDVTAPLRVWLGVQRARLDAWAARKVAGPAGNPVFPEPPDSADVARLRGDFRAYGTLINPSPDERWTFAMTWASLIEAGDNPMPRLFALAETPPRAFAVPPPRAESAEAPSPQGVTVRVSGGAPKIVVYGALVFAGLTSAGWAWSEFVEQPGLQRRAAQSDQLGVALSEAEAANASLRDSYTQAVRMLEAERAANQATIDRLEADAAAARRRAARETERRIEAQTQIVRALHEATGSSGPRSPDDWLRDLFPGASGHPDGGGAVSGVPGAETGDGDPQRLP